MFNVYPYLNVNDLNLDWIIAHFKEFIDEIASLDDWRAKHEKEYAELKQFMDDITAGNFPDSMYDAMRKWFYDNALDLVASMIKHVYFGLTNDGYFCAYIPENWAAITFDTITNYDDPLYGHLVLMYD